MVAFEMGNSSRSLWQAHSFSPAMTSNTCIRRGSARALAMSSNCCSVSGDRDLVFFTVQWLSNCLTVVKSGSFQGQRHRFLCSRFQLGIARQQPPTGVPTEDGLVVP